ncbi:hypothetical protein [Methylobacterium sp. SI9]|uniref:hypothetical protein n=1 Tax=Methylobacterium guangdongense TaxID=3138811 RepID=UPI00313B91F9
MRSLKLSSLFRRNAAAELRDRAADLQADLARVARPAVVEVPETPAPIRARSDDTELLSLGRRFEEARAHEVAACEACNAASKQSGAGEAPLELEAAAADAGDIAAALAYQLADIPAHSADGLRLKIRALAHYNPSFFRLGLPDNPDPDQVLARSLLLDAQGEAPTVEPTDWQNPPPGFMAYPADDPQGFVIVREGLRMELERLHRIASAEYARKVGPDAAEANRARIRRELRLDAFEAVAPNGDAEILALGLDLDAVHARWRAATPAYWAAQAHITQACERAKARGGPVHAASVAAWETPGISEACDAFDAIGSELERISKAIWRTPARTPLGLAVKARATLVMVFVFGQYERDSHLGKDEDLTPQATRALIEACCALAGVDWKGQPIGEESAAAVPSRPALSRDRAWAVAQASAVDLSALTILQLHNLYVRFSSVADIWCATSSLPWASDKSANPFRDLNAAGHIAEREEERASEIRSRLVAEIRARVPAGDFERNWRLETLIQYELLCEASLQHAPELRAEINKAWGD